MCYWAIILPVRFSKRGTCFYQLQQLRVVRRTLSTDAAKTLVHALISSRVDYCNCTLRCVCCSPASTAVSVEWGSTTDRRKANVRPHHGHHASRPPLAAGATAHPVQAVHPREQMPSSYGTDVSSWHVYYSVVYNRSSTSPLSCLSRLDNPAQSAGAIRTTYLCYLWSIDLELAATDCSRLRPDFYRFL